AAAKRVVWAIKHLVRNTAHEEPPTAMRPPAAEHLVFAYSGPAMTCEKSRVLQTPPAAPGHGSPHPVNAPGLLYTPRTPDEAAAKRVVWPITQLVRNPPYE